MFAHKDLLAEVPFFRFLDEDEVAELASSLEERRVEEGEMIFNFGDRGDSVYLVRSGHVELFVKDHTGEKIILRVAGPADIFGELSLLDNGPRTASAVALEGCDLCILSQKDLLQFLRKKPDASIDMLAALGGQIRQTNNLLRGRVSKNANIEMEQELSWTQRLANFIADFSGSMPFLILNAVLFVVWIVWNVDVIRGLKPFDPYPFGFLTMAVSLEAIFLSIFVLLAQNLQAAKDKIRGDIEYEVNLKAELEIAHLHEKIDQMNAEMLKHFQQIERSGH